MDINPLPFRAILEEYQKQAEQLLEAWKAGDPAAIQIFRQTHPRFLDDEIPWCRAHPAKAGLQVALVDRLLDFGAAIEGHGSGDWTSPLMTALAFGYQGAAEALVRRGARVDNIAAAAGLGRVADARQLLATASSEQRHRATALAAQHGHVEILRLLLDAGEDPNRYNPKGNHGHSTPLHQAVWSGHDRVVRLLVERGARLDIKDTIYEGTALGWAMYGGRTEIAEYLRAQGAKTEEA